MVVNARAGRVRVPETFPRERLVLGELHLLRGRLDGVLDEVGVVLRQPEVDEDGWPRVEEAARLARRALVAAVGAVPSLPIARPAAGLLGVGELRVDPWGGTAVVRGGGVRADAAAPPAVGGDGRGAAPGVREGRARCAGVAAARRAEAVKVSVSRLRRALVAAGAPGGRFLVSVHGVGWSLTRRA